MSISPLETGDLSHRVVTTSHPGPPCPGLLCNRKTWQQAESWGGSCLSLEHLSLAFWKSRILVRICLQLLSWLPSTADPLEPLRLFFGSEYRVGV